MVKRLIIVLLVASFTDAWIETGLDVPPELKVESHLLQMRGLKPVSLTFIEANPASHLLQMRGLKQKRCATSTGTQKSHLLQMRGLKQNQLYKRYRPHQVASFTDAWIET